MTYFECGECDYKASNKHHLWQHVRAIHDKARDFPCDQCDYKAAQKSNLKRHVKNVHKIQDESTNSNHDNDDNNSNQRNDPLSDMVERAEIVMQ